MKSLKQNDPINKITPEEKEWIADLKSRGVYYPASQARKDTKKAINKRKKK